MEPKPNVAFVERAASALQAEMERLDPADGRLWADLTDGERHFYLSLVEAIWPIIAEGCSIKPVTTS
jgi:hypothetical protein